MNRLHINTTKKPAFTMIELVFVIVILGILAAIAIPKISASRLDAQVAGIRQDIGTFTQAFAAMAMSQGNLAEARPYDPNDPSGGIVHNNGEFLGFENISENRKGNWREYHTYSNDVGFTHVRGIHSFLAKDGGSARSDSKACVILEIESDYSHDTGTSLTALVVDIKESPICQRIGPAGKTVYPIAAKNVKF